VNQKGVFPFLLIIALIAAILIAVVVVGIFQSLLVQAVLVTLGFAVIWFGSTKGKSEDLWLYIVGGIIIILFSVFGQGIYFSLVPTSLVFGAMSIPSYSYEAEILSTTELNYQDAMKMNIHNTGYLEALPVALIVDGTIVQDYIPPAYCVTEFCQARGGVITEKTTEQHSINLSPGTHTVQIMTLKDFSGYTVQPQPTEYHEGAWTNAASNWKTCYGDMSNCNLEPCEVWIASAPSSVRQNYSCINPSLKTFCLTGNSTGRCANNNIVEFYTLKEWVVTVSGTPTPTPTGSVPPTPTPTPIDPIQGFDFVLFGAGAIIIAVITVLLIGKKKILKVIKRG